MSRNFERPNFPPAFPTDDFYDEKLVGQYEGMGLRDYFAARAMQTLLAYPDVKYGDIANSAYAMADEMIKRRRKLQ